MSASSSWPNSTKRRAGTGMADSLSRVVGRVTLCPDSSSYSIVYLTVPSGSVSMLKIVAVYLEGGVEGWVSRGACVQIRFKRCGQSLGAQGVGLSLHELVEVLDEVAFFGVEVPVESCLVRALCQLPRRWRAAGQPPRPRVAEVEHAPRRPIQRARVVWWW